MCQAIAKPAGVRIYRKTLARAWEMNPDSGGFAWLDADSRIRYKRGYRDFNQFWRDYREHQDKMVMIHFRLATHGSKCIENCQPFVVGDNIMMTHNGILHEYTHDTKDRSDSRVFAEDVMTPMLAKFGASVLDNEQAMDVLDRMIGYNKLIFMTPAGFKIVCDYLGEWSKEGVEGGQVFWSSGYPDKGWHKVAMSNTWDEPTSEGYWETVPGGYINHRSESSQDWETYYKNKYGAGSVMVNKPQITVFDNRTGAPITTMPPASPGRNVIPLLPMHTGVTKSQVMESLERLDLEQAERDAAFARLDELDATLFPDEGEIDLDDLPGGYDAMVDAYIRNKEDE